MFFFFLSVLSYNHQIVILPYESYETCEILDTKKSSELMFDISSVSKGQVHYKLIKSGQPRLNAISTPMLNNKYREKFKEDANYTVIYENKNAEPSYLSIGSYIDSDNHKDENLQLLSTILGKSKVNLDNLVNANLKLKEFKENSLRMARKDRKWMLLLCIMPGLYVLVGFVSLRMQKNFFAPAKRK